MEEEKSESDYVDSDVEEKKNKKKKKNKSPVSEEEIKPPTPKKVQHGDPRPFEIGPIKIPKIYTGENTSAFKVQSRD